MSAVDVVLASASPRRRELLAAIGVSIRVMPADVDERALPGEAPPALVARLAAAKAGAVHARIAAAAPRSDGGAGGGDAVAEVERALVIAADTIVVVDGEVLGKPVDAAERRSFVERLAGRSHVVLSGHCLWRGHDARSHVERTVVTFRALDERDVAEYVASGEGDDKAGGYAIQGRGAGLVARIEGCYSNVVGLSLPSVIAMARDLGVRLG